MAKNSKSKKSSASDISTRTVIQIIFLVGTILIGLRHIMPGESSKGGAFDVFCPFGAIETLFPFLTTGQTLKTTSPLNFAILFGVLGVSLLAGRAFCGWMCPVGTLQDFLANLSNRLSINKKKQPAGKQISLPYKISPRNDAWLRSLKYLVLVIILLASTFAIYPPLREICPARALLSFQLTTPLLWSVLITFLITSMLNRRFWCKYLCPLGAVLAPFNKIAPLRLVLNQDSCTNCRRCDSACPMDIPDLTNNLRSAECIECLECQETCNEGDALELRLF
jgi:polyferredoxin